MVYIKGFFIMGWALYIVECIDETYYTGITNDIDRRIAQHNSGAGAKYTKGRAPVRLIYTEYFKNRSEASKRELQVKSLSKDRKTDLIKSIS